MANFESIATANTVQGSNGIPGCVLAVVDQTGRSLYAQSFGYSSVAHDASEIDSESVLWIASCTKLLGTIAALQCVERGQITLDEPVEHVLPELSNPEVIRPSGVDCDSSNATFTLQPSKKKITLRQLLSHTSGLAYDSNPLLGAWRASRKEQLLNLSGKRKEAFVVPLLFDPGEGWAYGGGIDMACEIVARLNDTSLEAYFRKHIFDPLGMESTTFRLDHHPQLEERLVTMTQRTKSGGLIESPSPWPKYAQDDCGGAGLYSTVTDYTKVLVDLLRDEPKLLKPETRSLMFTPQLQKGSPQMRELHGSYMTTGLSGVSRSSEAINFGLGGLFIEEDTGNHRGGSLVWGGMPNLHWFVNRVQGVAGMYASQVIPAMDPRSNDLAHEFVKHAFLVKGS